MWALCILYSRFVGSAPRLSQVHVQHASGEVFSVLCFRAILPLWLAYASMNDQNLYIPCTCMDMPASSTNYARSLLHIWVCFGQWVCMPTRLPSTGTPTCTPRQRGWGTP